MPFNYNQNLNAIQADPRIIEGASKSSFDIAGKAMTQLNDAIDNRAFERDISSVRTYKVYLDLLLLQLNNKLLWLLNKVCLMH
jgi:hypothetical protein